MPTSERFDAFEVVIGPLPYSDRLAEKTTACARHLADNPPWSCDVTIDDLAGAGLPAPSVVRPAKIACIEPARVLRRAGRVDAATARKVVRSLSDFLGSP
jgi:mRNA interferase MazF